MRALRLIAPGTEGLELAEVETPEPGAGEALVRVHAAAITRDELDWPADRLPATPSYELAGVVEAVGESADPVPGDEVFALLPFDRDGAAAEYVVVPSEVLAPKPRSLDHLQAAALPMAALSAWQGLVEHGGLEQGDRALVLGPAGGVGHLATQLARALGAELVDEEADVVFDTAGGELLAEAPSRLRHGGRVVTIAEEPPEGVAATYFVVEPRGDQLRRLGRLADEGALVPEIDSVFPLEEGRAAFERVAQRGKRGKVVLRVRE